MAAHDLNKYYEVALQLTKNCGQVIRDSIKKKKTIQTKGSEIDFVTETDQLVEKLLIEGLLKEFPDHRFIGEESVSAGKKCELTESPTWIIDPIDGTMNFVHTNPNICISIALLINKKTEIGIVYNPILELLYTARAGQGAYLNNEKISVSGQEELAQSLLAVELGYSRDPDKMNCVVTNMTNLIPKVHGIRSGGSAALNICSVASGWCDMYYEFGLHAWDMAAGDLVVREAGGVVVDTEGGPFDLMSGCVLCAASRPLADKLSSLLKQWRPPRD